MKPIMFALWIGLTAGLIWLADFTNDQNRELKREVRALRQEKQDIQRICPEIIRSPMGVPNGSN